MSSKTEQQKLLKSASNKQQHQQSGVAGKRVELKSKGMTWSQLIVWVINICVATAITYLALGFVCSQDYTPKFIHKAALPEYVLQSFAILMSVIIFVHSLLADFLQIVLDFTNHDLYRCHRNAINHSILWSTILWGALFVSWTRFHKMGLLVGLVDLYLVGRILFSFGYVVGTAIGHQSLRSVGMGLIFGTTLIALCQAIGFSIVQSFIR